MYRIPFLILLLGATAAHAEFARWTSKDGKVAELEFLKLEKKGEAETVSFRTRAGKMVTMSLEDLQEADRERARAASTTPFPVKGAGAVLEADFQKASGQPAKPKKDGEEARPPSIEFLFTVRGTAGGTFTALKRETLEMEPFEIGGKKVSPKNWQIAQGPNSTLSLTTSGNFDVAKLSGSKLSASVTVVAGSGMKTERLELKVPKDESKPSTGKVGPFTVHLTRDVRQVTVGIDAKDRSQVISYRLDGAPNGGASLDLLRVDKTVTVIVDYWEEVKEVPLKLEGTAA